MKKSYRKIGITVCLFFLSLGLISCKTNNDEDNRNEVLEKFNPGAIVLTKDGNIVNYNYEDNNYIKIDNKTIIAAYDYESNNYFGEQDKKYIANYNSKEKVLKDIRKTDKFFNMSPGGEHMLFFRQDEGNLIKILSLKDDEYIEFNTEVAISGKYIDWLDKNTIIYYGIRLEDKKNAIFKYNIDTKKEDILINLEEGNIEFLKTLDRGISYVLNDSLGNKKLLFYNIDSGDIDLIEDEILKVYDIVNFNEDYYIIGRFKNTNYSLFKISKNETKRMVYKFPKEISLEKGLIKTEDNKILFIGINSDKKEEIYQCLENGAISLLLDSSDNVSFLERTISQGTNY